MLTARKAHVLETSFVILPALADSLVEIHAQETVTASQELVLATESVVLRLVLLAGPVTLRGPAGAAMANHARNRATVSRESVPMVDSAVYTTAVLDTAALELARV